VWLNPEPEKYWEHIQSIGMTRALVEQRMFPLTIGGLDQAISTLRSLH
jgi:uncharacterized protein with von Willebrand factor type A (vWA) domain